MLKQGVVGPYKHNFSDIGIYKFADPPKFEAKFADPTILFIFY
jgi:hypothetical protein